jgi:hypothetical protein
VDVNIKWGPAIGTGYEKKSTTCTEERCLDPFLSRSGVFSKVVLPRGYGSDRGSWRLRQSLDRGARQT